MRSYLSLSGLASKLGKDVRNLTNAPAPDVIIGRWRGWQPGRVRDGKVTGRRRPPEQLLSLEEVAARLGIEAQTVNRLREPGTKAQRRTAQTVRQVQQVQRCPFPDPVARIENTEAANRPRHGRDGSVYGWAEPDITKYAQITGRVGGGLKGKRGRPAGSGDYTALPRCQRPRTESRHGKGKPCQAVRRKVNGQWGPACGLHLTDQERLQLGL